MSDQFNTGFIRLIEHVLTAENFTDGNRDFDLNPRGPGRILVEYFIFINSAGTQVNATAGTVTVTLSSGEDVYRNVQNGTFNANTAHLATWAKPQGVGRADKIRFNLSGIVGVGITGFRALVTQNAG